MMSGAAASGKVPSGAWGVPLSRPAPGQRTRLNGRHVPLATWRHAGAARWTPAGAARPTGASGWADAMRQSRVARRRPSDERRPSAAKRTPLPVAARASRLSRTPDRMRPSDGRRTACARQTNVAPQPRSGRACPWPRGRRDSAASRTHPPTAPPRPAHHAWATARRSPPATCGDTCTRCGTLTRRSAPEESAPACGAAAALRWTDSRSPAARRGRGSRWR